ncbi:response regulator transcription factor [Nocardioides terrisoli]|uniref:response regulator transcription factor n=1 Tax=Nocardioides terrisoli TaxID=3388267 RepID=UPI00287B6015|nr:response regulator [Nocardioides marmorisolisilvae]
MSRTPIRVLVVDDDFLVASIHKAFVERTEGFEVVGEANSAADALALANELAPDLVLMDVYLPDGSGLDVVRSLLEQDEPPQVIMISAARELESVRTAMRLGALHFLVKPFSYPDLAERLQAFRRLHERLEGLDESPEQAQVDELFGMMRTVPAEGVRLPKGHSVATLTLIRDAVRDAGEPLSAGDVSTRTGVSRATAQRYLSYLQRTGALTLQLRYGTSGRPENLYRMPGPDKGR